MLIIFLILIIPTSIIKKVQISTITTEPNIKHRININPSWKKVTNLFLEEMGNECIIDLLKYKTINISIPYTYFSYMLSRCKVKKSRSPLPFGPVKIYSISFEWHDELNAIIGIREPPLK
jgi:hypothetical protein